MVGEPRTQSRRGSPTGHGDQYCGRQNAWFSEIFAEQNLNLSSEYWQFRRSDSIARETGGASWESDSATASKPLIHGLS